MRQSIERAFGMLTKRWGIFWRELQFSFNYWSTVITVCANAKLHNWCIDHNDQNIAPRWHEDYQNGDAWEVFNNNRTVVDEDGLNALFRRPE